MKFDLRIGEEPSQVLLDPGATAHLKGRGSWAIVQAAQEEERAGTFFALTDNVEDRIRVYVEEDPPAAVLRDLERCGAGLLHAPTGALGVRPLGEVERIAESASLGPGTEEFSGVPPGDYNVLLYCWKENQELEFVKSDVQLASRAQRP